MISYCWDNQPRKFERYIYFYFIFISIYFPVDTRVVFLPVVVEFAKALKNAGFHVWLDIEQVSLKSSNDRRNCERWDSTDLTVYDQMRGSTLEAMADAIEGAWLVIVGASQSYKNSAACRAEVLCY